MSGPCRKRAAADRIASTWYSATSSFDIDINLTDGNWHQIAFYCLDWDSNEANPDGGDSGRRQRNCARQPESGGLQNGRYLVWNLAGHVKIRATKLGAYNASSTGSSLICLPARFQLGSYRFSEER